MRKIGLLLMIILLSHQASATRVTINYPNDVEKGIFVDFWYEEDKLTEKEDLLVNINIRAQISKSISERESAYYTLGINPLQGGEHYFPESQSVIESIQVCTNDQDCSTPTRINPCIDGYCDFAYKYNVSINQLNKSHYQMIKIKLLYKDALHEGLEPYDKELFISSECNCLQGGCENLVKVVRIPEKNYFVIDPPARPCTKLVYSEKYGKYKLEGYEEEVRCLSYSGNSEIEVQSIKLIHKGERNIRYWLDWLTKKIMDNLFAIILGGMGLILGYILKSYKVLPRIKSLLSKISI